MHKELFVKERYITLPTELYEKNVTRRGKTVSFNLGQWLNFVFISINKIMNSNECVYHNSTLCYARTDKLMIHPLTIK